MLKIIDHGCARHHGRQFTVADTEAELMRDLFYNLPRVGDLHTFICSHGHTHSLSIQIQALKAA